MSFEIKIITEKQQYSFSHSKDKETNPEVLNNQEFPDWVNLDYQKCNHCPLSSKIKWCPAAASMNGAVQIFPDLISFDQVKIEFIHDEVTYSENTSAAKALTILLVAQMAFSSCPAIQVDYWSWKFFSPKITIENYLFRRLAIRLVCEHVSKIKGEKLTSHLSDDLDMLKTTIKQLDLRLRSAENLNNEAFYNAMNSLNILLESSDNFESILYNELELVLKKENEI